MNKICLKIALNVFLLTKVCCHVSKFQTCMIWINNLSTSLVDIDIVES